MLLDILLAILIVVCLSLIGVILLQRSEGGALGMSGGGPGAFMTARGTGDLLTRTTQILAAVFFSLCLAMTLISGHSRGAGSLVDRLKLNALGATSSEKPLSGAPGLPGGPLNNPAAPFGSAGPAPFGAPQPQGNSLNLLGSPQAPLAAPVAHPAAAGAPRPAAPAVALKPAASSTPPAKVVKAAKPAAAPAPAAPAAASAAPPAVTPAPLVVPPAPAPTPAPSAAGNAASGQ
ncbi:MAG TPA: preprotein translocase subunit SecG [Caulobacteraceae bacterium]